MVAGHRSLEDEEGDEGPSDEDDIEACKALQAVVAPACRSSPVADHGGNHDHFAEEVVEDECSAEAADASGWAAQAIANCWRVSVGALRSDDATWEEVEVEVDERHAAMTVVASRYGGMSVDAHTDEGGPVAALQAASRVAQWTVPSVVALAVELVSWESLWGVRWGPRWERESG